MLAATSAINAVFSLSNKAKGYVGEANGWQEALDRGEIPIKSPHAKNINAHGPDYITLEIGGRGPVLRVYDAAWKTKSLAEVTRNVRGAWRPYISDAINGMAEGPLKRAAREAWEAGAIEPRRYLYK
jgi:hypothetical protein